ncbi:hypothetical protein C8046_03690 [Serinibacter arcticus]|uniref:DoxX family protein n=1 Tax=Serinibacter arcticus TaxID=1655435 RepID=A0A2U1ZSG2_9MICO|nr:DoxX family protein [Serinibacter arcticus]PWD49916.1 hypothetical protein C8046_03690 [Serinibacter arcticus]
MTTPRTATTSSALGSPATTSLGLLVARLALAVVMIAHGAQKVFTFTLEGTAASFADMGVPAASVAGPALAIFELVGGIVLLLGLGTRIIAALNVVAMLGALVIVHLSAGFFAGDGGYEFVLVLAAVSLTLVLTGPGAFSLDAVIARRRRRD